MVSLHHSSAKIKTSSIMVVFFSSLLQVTSSWPVIHPGLDQIQTAVNCPGSKVGRAIVSCYPSINKNKHIAVSCFLQGHCFHGQEEALCGGPGANFICTLRGQIMPSRLLEKKATWRWPAQLVSGQVFPCLDFLAAPELAIP